MSNSRIAFVKDIIILDELFSNKLIKNASFTNDLIQKATSYFKEHADSENVLDMLAPGVIWTIFSSMGLSRVGMFIGFLMNVLHINTTEFLSEIWNKVKSIVEGGNKITPQQIDNITSSTAQQYSDNDISNVADDNTSILKDAFLNFEKEQFRLIKKADIKAAGIFGGKAKGASLFGKLIGIIFKIALRSAGLMVAGDIANKLLHQPNAFDKGTLKNNPSSTISAGPTSTQTIFPLKSNSPMPDSVPLTNTPDNIDNAIIQFAKDTYQGLDGKEDEIKNTKGFQVVKNEIAWFNIRNPNSNAIFMPGVFNTKKQLVDYFIDQVAAQEQSQPQQA